MNEFVHKIKCLRCLLNKYSEAHSLSIDEQESLFDICQTFSDTNNFIQHAEIQYQNDAEFFFETIHSMNNDIDELITLLKSHPLAFYAGFNTKLLCDKHLSSFNERWARQNEKTQKLWNDYCVASNRMDYTQIDSKEYTLLSEFCDQVKKSHDESKSLADMLYAEYKSQECKVVHSMFFDIVFVDMLLSQLSDILTIIINELDSTSKNDK